MLLNPHIAAAVQDEIDTVVGRRRLPVFDDLDSMPYLLATVKEVLRYAYYSSILILALTMLKMASHPTDWSPTHNDR